jgi:spore coat polysaccharide biosynthesis protein SpsF
MVVNGLKVGAIIQARIDSTRLPGKVLLNLPFDSSETVLSRIVNRLKMLNNTLPIIATSDERTDDPIERYAKNNNIQLFRGSKDNVLERFVKASQTFNLDVVIRITGDNPIVLIDFLETAIKNHIASKVDLSRNIGLPYGTSFEIINFESLKKALNESTSKEEREHVTIFIKNRKNEFKILENDFSQYQFKNKNVRLTVDYPSDYALMNILFQNKQMHSNSYSFETIKMILDSNDWLNEINANNIQKKQFNNLEEELFYVKTLLKQLELNNVLKLIDDNIK